jgi:hypothetical protein
MKPAFGTSEQRNFDMTRNGFYYLSAIALALLVVGISVLLRSAMSVGHGPDRFGNLSYEMPRMKAFQPHFGLDGFKVQREYVNPFAQKNGPAAAPPVSGAPAAPAPNLSKSTTAHVRRKGPSTSAQNKKTGIETRIVDRAQSDTLSGPTDLGGAVGQPVGTQAEVPREKPTLSANEWRIRLLTDPSAANVNAFVSDYKEHKIDEEGFYQVVNELLNDRRVEVQVAGVLCINGTASSHSFTTLVDHYDKLEGKAKSFGSQVFESYKNDPQMTQLLGVPHGDNKNAILRATLIMVASVKNYRNTRQQTAQRSVRESRGVVAPSNSKSYSQFIDALQGLQTNSDPAIRQAATSTISQIQSILSARQANNS